MSLTPEVLLQTVGKIGIIKLARPKALNALNLSMINQIYPQLKKWESEVPFVVITGEGDKAFCAGGDVRAVIEAGKKQDPQANSFFRNEYKLNHLIGTLKIPYVALINGITMGGGVGLSVHGHYRVATEKTVFSMPETAIGLFPDVGGSYFLPRMAGNLGTYLALTGCRLTGLDVLKSGIATHFCDSVEIKNLLQDLCNLNDSNGLQNVLNHYNEKSLKTKDHEFVLQPVISKINNTFCGETIEEILKLLEDEGSDWSVQQIDILRKMSPTSLKITLKALRNGRKLDLKECLKMEFRMAQFCLRTNDFYEGVRAVLIDRDNKPVWKPSKLALVTEEQINDCFSPLSLNEELEL